MEKIVCATANPHKVTEFQRLLGSKFNLCSLADLAYFQDIPENQNSLEGNALEKARFVYNKFALPCFADDTGFEIEALNGAPGVFSARYAGEGKNSQDNIEKVLFEMKDIDNRRARFRCVIALIIDGDEHLFEGIVNGEVLRQPVGSGGFGYDSIFRADNYDVSFAQMSLDGKNKISHRGRAIAKLAEYLSQI